MSFHSHSLPSDLAALQSELERVQTAAPDLRSEAARSALDDINARLRAQVSAAENELRQAEKEQRRQAEPTSPGINKQLDDESILISPPPHSMNASNGTGIHSPLSPEQPRAPYPSPETEVGTDEKQDADNDHDHDLSPIERSVRHLSVDKKGVASEKESLAPSSSQTRREVDKDELNRQADDERHESPLPIDPHDPFAHELVLHGIESAEAEAMVGRAALKGEPIPSDFIDRARSRRDSTIADEIATTIPEGGALSESERLEAEREVEKKLAEEEAKALKAAEDALQRAREAQKVASHESGIPLTLQTAAPYIGIEEEDGKAAAPTTSSPSPSAKQLVAEMRKPRSSRPLSPHATLELHEDHVRAAEKEAQQSRAQMQTQR